MVTDSSSAKCVATRTATFLVVLYLTVVCASQGFAQDLKPLNVLMFPGLIHEQNLRVAIGAGFFKKYGLDVTLVQVESGPAGAAAVQGGSIDIGATDSNLLLLSNVKGTDFQIVCGGSGQYMAAIAGPSMAPATLDGLAYPAGMKIFVGKKLGVTGLGSSTHFFWRALFDGAGLDPDSATYVPVGLAASASQALRTQRIDAYMGFEPIITMIRDGGLGGKVVFDLRPPAHQGPAEVTQIDPQLIFYAKRIFISANEGKVTAFNRALMDAAAWQQNPANLDKLAEIMKPTVAIGQVSNPEAVLRKMVQDNIPVSTATKVTRDGLRAWIKFVQKFSGYPATVDIEKTIDETIWKGACS